ncbi:porin family protein [Prevotella sp. 10(H)]|uniref:porin family protein n=1 Tax=Prevotella sp. 10(H) TaxID=1158294 RepID=UPI0004A6CA7C|nr:porin family protein [Prevotella sp. 10(H)]
MKTTFKSCLVIITLLLFVTSANAQDKPLTFGVKAGMNLSNFSGDGADGMDAKIGFNVGVTVDYQLTQELYLLTGLEFTMKGGKDKGTLSLPGYDYTYTGEEKDNPMYLQIPIHLGYKLAVADATNIVFHAGPYIAYGVGGKSKIKGSYASAGENAYVDTDIDFFGKDRAKKFDMGLGLGATVEFGKIGVGLGYDFGLLNMSRSSELKVRNMNAYLTLGYKF